MKKQLLAIRIYDEFTEDELKRLKEKFEDTLGDEYNIVLLSGKVVKCKMEIVKHK